MKLDQFKLYLPEIITFLQTTIEEAFRAYEDDDEPGILLTIACDDEGNYEFQSGDLSYMGGVYGMPYMTSEPIYRDTNPQELTKMMLDSLEADKDEGID